jgi:uncharacterized protein
VLSLLGAACALLVGLSLGLLGGGGSILAVPIFVYVLGFDAKPAIAMSLAVVGAIAFLGFISHWRQGNVRVRVALAFGAFAMMGAFAGARGARLLPDGFQLGAFAIAALIAAVLMIRKAHRAGRVPIQPEPPERELPAARGYSNVLLAIQGVATGLVTGTIGIGGGFLIVPALVLAARLSMREAVGTSLLVISLNAASGFVGYLDHTEIAWATMGSFVAVAALGIIAARFIGPHIPQRRLEQGFSAALLLVGLYTLWAR